MTSQPLLFDAARVSARSSSTRYIPNSRVDLIREHSDNPHLKLWRAVIDVAYRDYKRGLLHLAWFYTDEAKFIADLCGYDHDYLIRRVKEMVG